MSFSNAWPCRLNVSLQPSYCLALCLLVVHVATGWAMTQLPFSLVIRIALVVCVCASAGVTIAHYALVLTPTSIRCVGCGDEGWVIKHRNGRERPVTLADDTVVWRGFIGLMFRDERGWLRVPIVFDALHSDDFRRLGVWLRWGDVGRT